MSCRSYHGVLHNLKAEKYPYLFDPGNAGEKKDKIERASRKGSLYFIAGPVIAGKQFS